MRSQYRSKFNLRLRINTQCIDLKSKLENDEIVNKLQFYKIILRKVTPKKQTKVVKCTQNSRCLRLKVSFFRIQPSTNNLGSQAAEWKTLTTTWAVSGVCSCSVFTVCPVDRSVKSDTGALARWTNTCYLWMDDLNNKLLIARRPLHFNILSGNVSCRHFGVIAKYLEHENNQQVQRFHLWCCL